MGKGSKDGRDRARGREPAGGRAAERAARMQRASASPHLLVDNWDHLVVNDRYVRMLVVSEWTSTVRLGWAESFMALSGVSAPATLVLRRSSGDALRANLNRTANETDPWTADRATETYLDRVQKAHEADMAARAASLVVSSNARIYEMYLYIKLSAPTLEELDRETRDVQEHVEGLQMRASCLSANQMQMYWAASPCLMHDPYVEERFNYSAPTTTVARGLWNRDRGICDPVGFPLGRDDQGMRVRLDMLSTSPSRPSRNVFVSGETGSGKSTLLKMLIVHYRTLADCKVIINDVDGEYGWLARRLGGKVVRLGEGSSMLASPFEPRNTAGDAGGAGDAAGLDAEVAEAFREAGRSRVLSTHLPFLVSYLLRAFGLDARECKDTLHRACELAYYGFGIDNDTTFDDYYAGDGRYPEISDVYDRAVEIGRDDPDRRPACARILQALQRAVTGSEAHMWRGSSERIPDSKVVCIDMQGLSSDEDMRAAQYYNILSWEWSQVRGHRYDSTNVVILADEVHVIAKNADAIYMIKDMAQRIRKYGGALVTATQMVTDLMRADIRDAGQGIVENSTYKFFGAVSGDPTSSEENNLKHVKSLLGATNEVMERLAKAGRGRFILRVGAERETWLDVERPDWMVPLFGKGGGR